MDQDYNTLAEWPLRDLQEARHQLRAMLASPGWRVFQGFVNRDLAGRIAKMAQPCSSLEGVLGAEYAKGQYDGTVMPFRALEGWLEELNQAISYKEQSDVDPTP